MSLTVKQKNYLRALAQHRQVIVTVGAKGVTDAVMKEIDQALVRHELLKIRLPLMQRPKRVELQNKLNELLRTELIQSIGRVLILYRRSKTPKITFPV